MSHCAGYYVEPGRYEYPFPNGKPFWEADFPEGEPVEGLEELMRAEKEELAKEDATIDMDDEEPLFDVEPEWLKQPEPRRDPALPLVDRTETKDFGDEIDASSSSSTDEAIFASLEPRLREKTKEAGVVRFFPIQRAVLPHSIATAGRRDHDGDERRDLCLAAPTGSGKTLIYALTLLHSLVPRTLKMLRGIVVAPSRELARQIHKEMSRFVPDEEVVEEDLIRVPKIDVRCEVSKMYSAFRADRGDIPDILVTTPGRLVDRLDEEDWQRRGTERDHSYDFSVVDQLQYLVVDEADRLVEQEYSGWARKLLGKRASIDHDAASERVKRYFKEQNWLDVTKIGRRPTIPLMPTTLRLRKLLFSATLGDDPRQLTTLRVQNPLFFFVDAKRHSVVTETTYPAKASEAAKSLTLSETLIAEEYLVTDAAQKPLCFLALIEDDVLGLRGDDDDDDDSSRQKVDDDDPSSQRRRRRRRIRAQEGVVVVIFCNAVDTVVRVAALCKLVFEDRYGAVAKVAELSSAANAKQRQRAIADADRERRKKPLLIVASDAASRGLDLPSAKLVINYDAPNDPKTYVHRLGRTARAGKPGAAATLLKKGQEAAFSRMRASVDRDDPSLRPPFPKKRLAKLAPAYRDAVANLKAKIADMRRAHRSTGETTTAAP